MQKDLTAKCLNKMIEECSEVIHISCKILKFGWFRFNPNDSEKTMNFYLLQREMNDVLDAFNQVERLMELTLLEEEARHEKDQGIIER